MKKIRLLLLADANSVHTLKWVDYLRQTEKFEICVFSINLYNTIYYRDKNIEVFSATQNRTLRKNSSGIAKLRYLLTLHKLKGVLRKFQPDIVHAHYASSYGLLGRLLRFHPFIISVWGSDAYDFPKRSFIHRFILKKNLQSADKIAATSKALAEETMKYTDKSIQITPFGIDTELFYPQKSKGFFSEHDFVIGTVKSLEAVYGIEFLIKAFAILSKKHPDISLKLLIVGTGSQKEWLVQLSQELGIFDRVTFAGFVEHKDLIKYYNMLDVFVALSLSESFGVAVLEASSCAVPVVVSDVGGLPEVVDNEVTGLVVPAKNEISAAEAIEKLMLNDTYRLQMGANGRKKVTEQYTWSENAQKMVELYTDIMQNKSIQE